MSLTLAQIRAAQANDLTALAAVISYMDERVSRLAAQASRRLDGDHREDFEQDAREALFLALPRAEGDDVDRVIGFLYASMSEALKDKVRAARYQGVDKDAVKVFMSVMEEAEGDAYKAEQLAQTVPAKGLRLSADRAQAARLAWQGAVSIDKQTGEDEGASLADVLAVTDEQPLEVRPKVGTGAALEALAVLQRYCTAREVLNALPWNAEDIEAMEDAVKVPRDAAERRYVLDAFAILRSFVSTATDGEVTEDLRDVSDDLRDERSAKIAMVREALNKMATQQRNILVLSFGIAGGEEFGWGDGSDVAGLAEYLNTSVGNLKKQRSVGKVSFAKFFIALAARTEAEALSWAAAAEQMRKPGGRK
jgi:hypothetical protein